MGNDKFKAKLDAEIQALEEKYYPKSPLNPAEAPADALPAQGSQDQKEQQPSAATDPAVQYEEGSEKNFNVNQAQPVQQTQEEPTPPEGKKKRTDWKGRFTKLKQYHDAEIYKLRKLTGDLYDKINMLEADNRRINEQLHETLKVQPKSIKDLATPEEIDRVGEDELNVVDRLVQQRLETETKDLRKKIKDTEEREAHLRNQQAQDARAQAYNIFLGKLGAAVPDYAELDKDPRFEGWLAQPDPYSGFSRMDLFKQAEHSGDVGRVAHFFKEFRETIKPMKETLDNKVTPVGNTAVNQPAQPNAPEIIPMQEYMQFMDDSTRGRYKGRESEERALEQKYNKAIAEGRLR